MMSLVQAQQGEPKKKIHHKVYLLFFIDFLRVTLRAQFVCFDLYFKHYEFFLQFISLYVIIFFATQLNIWTNYERSIFILVKMHSLFWLSLMVCQSCVAAIGVMHFSVRSFGCALFILQRKNSKMGKKHHTEKIKG